MHHNRNFKIKNKIAFYVMCILWLASMILFGMVIQNPIFAVFLMCVFSTIAIWQTNLDDKQTTTCALSFFGINSLLGLMAGVISLLLDGDVSSAISTLVTVIITFSVVVGLPILFFYWKMKKKNVGWNDVFIQKQSYTEELWEKKQEQSFAMAKRVSVMSHLVGVISDQLRISFVLFLVTLLGIDALAHFGNMDCRIGPFFLTKGIFIPVMVFLLISLCIVGFWLAIGYKRLEVRCLHLGYELQGARELNEAAQRANFINQMAKLTDIPAATMGGADNMASNIADNYLLMYNKKPINPTLFKVLNRVLMVAQFLLAAGVFAYSVM